MTLLSGSAALLFLVASSAAVAAVPLDDLIAFDDPYRCVPAKDLDALLTGVIQWCEDGDSYKGALATPPVPSAVQEQVGRPTLTIEGNEYWATVPLHGTWQGLPLHSLLVVQWIESEDGFYLVFDAPPEQVREAANRAGFQIPTSGSEYRDLNGVLGVNVGIDPSRGKGALFCIRG